MAWNSDDGTRYRTDDGHTFNTEKDVEDHYKKLAEDSARSEELAKYLAKLKGICNQAWDLINKGNYKEAENHLYNNSTKKGEYSYSMPWQFFYPMGYALDQQGYYNDAINNYTTYLESYKEGGGGAMGGMAGAALGIFVS